jgi:MFS transporter, PAT family, beta-lactamase induction signal transducer AmpG
VLLFRMTQKRFSATQYALFTSLFALPRLLAGPIAGVAVDAMGWSAFFLSTLVIGVPGLAMLARFVPLGVREPVFRVEERAPGRPLGRLQIAARGVLGGLLVGSAGFVLDAALFAVKTMRETKGAGFDLGAAMWRLAHPMTIADWMEVGGIAAFAIVGGLFVAALTTARRGAGRSLDAAQDAAP